MERWTFHRRRISRYLNGSFNMRMRFWIGVALLIIASGLFAYRGQVGAWVNAKIEYRRLPPPTSSTSVPKVITALPAEFNLAVPFTPQAPFEDWNLPYKEACEEASVAMVDAFYKGRKFNKASATTEILGLVEWQTKILGHFEDTNAEQTARILRERYGYKNVRVVYEPTLETIKREVAQGRPVILPAAGRLLKNRYFRQPGPVYHMLLVRGWTKDGLIITNDPGTKRGEGYLYKSEVLMNAVHDWNGGDVLNGRKVMIVVEK